MSTVNDIINQVNRLSGYRLDNSVNASGSNTAVSGTISTSGIYPGAIIKSDQVLRIIEALDGTSTDTIIISGSLLTSGSNVFRGTTTLSGSLALNFVSESQFLLISGGLVKGTNDIPSSSFSTSASYATTSSLPLLGIVTASAIASTVTFTKGDKTTFDIVISQSGSVETASYTLFAENAGTSSIAITASYVKNAQTASFLANSTVPNEAARYALTSSNIYPGLLVYQEDVRLTFLLVDITNVNNSNGWMVMLTGGSSVSGSQTISGSLNVLGSITGSLFGTASYALTASFAINAGSSFLITTGSVVAQVSVDPTSLFFINSGSTRLINVNNEGVLMLNQLSSAPNAVTGGLYFDTSGNFFVGL